MKKLFFLVSRIPYPLEKGDKLRAYHQLRYLSSQHDVTLCCLSLRKPDEAALEHLRTFCRVEVIRLSSIGLVFRLALALFSSRPFQVHYFYRQPARRKIQKLINELEPDHIYCQLIRCSEYVKHIHHIPKTLDYMDAFNKGTERLASVSGWWKRQFWLTESKRLVRYENLIFDYFDHHTIISDQDRQLIYHEQRKRIQVIPNGVDTDYFHPSNEMKQTTLVFTGNMSYPPNVDGAEFLVNQILPLVRKEHPEISVLLAGANPSVRVRALASEGVEVTGWMDDIRDAYGRSAIFIAPMRIGTGLQNKLLEAMSMELPCITSKLANNALKATPNEEVLIGESPEEYAALIHKLLVDPSSRTSIGKAGRNFVKARFSWEASAQELTKIFFG
ncbi:MAG: hypothetical protein RL226_1582 [Bacteroidota bacterium]|jgi:sugar transferase (PEP-CTERM/EpsH1 system associated)